MPASCLTFSYCAKDAGNVDLEESANDLNDSIDGLDQETGMITNWKILEIV